MSGLGILVRLRFKFSCHVSHYKFNFTSSLRNRSSVRFPGIPTSSVVRFESGSQGSSLTKYECFQRVVCNGNYNNGFLTRQNRKFKRAHAAVGGNASFLKGQNLNQGCQFHASYVPLTKFPLVPRRNSIARWQRTCVKMPAPPQLPLTFVALQLQDQFRERNVDLGRISHLVDRHNQVNLNQMIVRNFTTSCQSHGRHRTYSVDSSRTGCFDSESWKRNEQESSNEDVLGTASLMQEKMKNNVNHRMSNIKIRLIDQNKNIKEKISIHRSKGVKAVRKLRRKLETQKEDIRTIPNLLTTLRMASAPVLGYLVVSDYFGCALSIFVLAGFTDLLDGYIARNFKNQRTALGTALDPLADKLLMCCLTLSLTSAGLIPVPLTVLILSRDAGLVLASFVIRYKTLSPPRTLSRYFDVTHVTAKLFPSTISKINTGLQLSYVACVLASPVFEFIDHPLLQVLMYTTAATTFLSGLDYIITWRRRLKIVKNK